MSQPRRRPPVRAQPKRRSNVSNRNQRVFAILGVVVVVSLIATVIGPPLVDYITQSDDDDPDVAIEAGTDDPVERDYRDQIEANPGDTAAIAGLANYLGNTGRVDEAIELYERALAIEPENWATRLGFARVLSNGGKRPDAELQFEKVLAACPGSEQAFFSLGQLYAGWVPPRTGDAVAAFQHVLVTGKGTFVEERAMEELARLGLASPLAASPVAAVPAASPSANQEACP